MVKYPTGLDTDAELPRVEDNITEIGGEAINSLRAAVFAIEKALGIRPQGTAADLAARLGASLDNNGNIKASALSGIGLVTLPITNAQVGAAAGIEESKLDLNYGTALLKSWIDSLRVRVDALEAAVAADIANLAQHVASPSTWGRHRTSDIDAYDVFAGMNAQGALTDLDTRLEGHIADPADAHPGSAISLDPDRFTSITAEDVQTGAEQLEALQLVEIIRHRDRQHGNGILGTQDAFVPGTRHGVEIVAPAATTSGSVGDTFIKFAVAPPSSDFLAIARNDRIDLVAGGKTHTFVVESTQSTNQVNIFGQVPVAGGGTATVYRNSEETSEPSAVMLCIRKDDLLSRPSTLQLVHPSAPYILSSGCQPSALSPTVRNIRLLYPNGDTDDLDAYAAMSAFSPAPRSTWTVENMAKVLNASLFSPGIGDAKHPITAFAYKGELGLAYALPDESGFLEIGVTSGNDATTVLGLVAGTMAHSLSPRELYIDGYEIPSINTLLEAQGEITASDTITFPGLNPLALGVEPGQIAYLYNANLLDGYVIQDVTNDSLVFDPTYEFDFSSEVGQWVRVSVYADAFSLASAPAQRTLYEMFLDGYDDGYGPVAGLRASARVKYADTSGGGSGLESIMDITAVSRTFGAASRRVFYDYSAHTAVLGTPVAGPSLSDLGTKVVLPSSGEQGFRFALYDANGVDYVEFELANGLPGSDGYMDITVLPRISEERFLQVATVLHDRTRFKHLVDTRQFGTVGRQDVRDDFTRDYVSYPRSLLRGNGVVYGFSASGTGTGTLVVQGGQGLVNGQLKSVGKKSFTIPSDGAATYNLFMDTDGVLRLLRDDYFATGVLSTPSLSELLSGKTETVLAQVVVGGASTITAITDLRRFVNDIDSKLDLLVEENGITNGSFASLAAAAAYLNNQPSGSPYSRTIRVRGEVFLSGNVALPDHIILAGDGYGPGTIGSRITYLSSSATITLGAGAMVRDLSFYRSGTLSPGFLSATSITHARIENCAFEFASQAAGNIAISCGHLNETQIRSCEFKNVGKGIWADKGSVNCHIAANIFNGVQLNAIVIEAPSGYGVTDMLIAENGINTAGFTDTTGVALIRLVAPWNTIVRGNTLTTSSSAIAARSMLHVQGTSLGCKIVDNAFGNSGTGTGFLRAIWFDGTGSPMHMYDSIIGNGFLNFNGANNKTMLLNNANGTTVSGNMTPYCATPLEITEGNWMIIKDNFFQAMDDAPVLNIASPSVGEHFVIENNIITNGSASSTYSIVTLETISATPLFSSGIGGVFSGNTVQYSGLIPTAKAAVYVDGMEWRITNNEIGGANALAVFSVEAPLVLTADADGTLVAFNNFYHRGIGGVTYPISVDSGALRVIEMMNRGMTYTSVLPVSRSVGETGTSWQHYMVATPYKSEFRNTGAASQQAALEFSSTDVPVGVLLKSIKIYVSVGNTADVIFYWRRTVWNLDSSPAGEVFVGPVSPSGTGYTTVTLTAPAAKYMRSDDVHILEMVTGGAPSGNIWIAGVEVVWES